MHRHTTASISIALLAWCISIIFFNSQPGKVLELKGLDYLFYLRGPVPSPTDIVIVIIDEQSTSEFKTPWPWPRGIHARLIDTLKDAGASVIGFNILFADPSDEEIDITLARSIERAGNVILPSNIDITDEHGYRQITKIEPLALFKNVSRGVGAATIIYDKDNFVRRSRLRFGSIKSFAFEALKAYGILLDNIDRDVLINFIGPPRSIKTVSYYQALNYKDYLPPDIFKGNIVLIGKEDIFYTPRFPRQMSHMSGTEIIANTINTILHNRYIEIPGRLAVYLTLLLIFLLLSIIEIRTGYIPTIILTIFSTILAGGISYYYFSYKNTILPIFMPVVGIWLVFGTCSLTKYFMVEQEKRYIKNAFQKYVPPGVVKKILESPERLRLGGEEITGTVLFSDLERFTSISERFSPEKLVSFINEYLTEMSDIIFKHNGTITRFIGDAILAVWGAPVWQEDHALKAVTAAMEMTDRLKKLNIEWKAKGMPELRMRIGINTGPMVVGNVGSRQHIDYTAMGDSVNLAARLEELNKNYGTSIIIGHSTYESVNKNIEARKIDTVRIRGKEEPVEIYEPINLNYSYHE